MKSKKYSSKAKSKGAAIVLETGLMMANLCPIYAYAATTNSKNSITFQKDSQGKYYVLQNGQRKPNLTGAVKYQGIWYRIKNGYIDWGYNNFIKIKNSYYYFKNGRTNSSLNNLQKGTIQGTKTWYKVKKGKVDFTYNGLAQSPKNNQWYAVRNGKVWFSLNTDAYQWNGTVYQVRKGQVTKVIKKAKATYQLKKLSNGQLAYYKNGKLYTQYTGEVNTKSYGTVLVQQGYVTWKFNGLLRTKSGVLHYFQKSRLSSYTGILKVNGTQWLFIKGIQQPNWNGTVTQKGVTYKIQKGKVVSSSKQKSTVAYENGKFVDINKHNGSINFNTMKQTGVKGVMMRAAYEYTEDSMFEENSTKVEQAGLNYGVYQFGTFHYNTTTKAMAMEQARNQANSLIQILKGKKVTGYVALDLENEDPSRFTVYLSPEDLTDVANYWMSLIRAAGYKPMLYCSVSWLKNKMNVNNITVPLWVAYYSSGAEASNQFPDTTWGQYMTSIKDKIYFWQYSSSGDLAEYGGSDGRIDLDYSYRSFTGKVVQTTN